MKTYTIQQARELVPLLRAEMLILQPAFSALRLKWESIAKEHGISVDDPLVRKICETDPAACKLIETVEKEITLFDELGIICKSIENGLFDFPCLIEDRMVYLCWQLDETDICHWHELDNGFAARRSLFEAVGRGRDHEHAILN